MVTWMASRLEIELRRARYAGTASFFDPGPLLGNQTLHKLRPFLLVGLHSLQIGKQFANLRIAPSFHFAISNPVVMTARLSWSRKPWTCSQGSWGGEWAATAGAD